MKSMSKGISRPTAGKHQKKRLGSACGRLRSEAPGAERRGARRGGGRGGGAEEEEEGGGRGGWCL